MIEYIPILVIMTFAVLIGVLIVGASHILGHRISGRVKLAPYECGMETIGPTRMRIKIRYYITAMLFLIFDIEILFLYPWAVVAGNLKLFGFVEMLIFIIILLIGYVYVWRKGALEWE
jgi:NADH-quinone oxidoreductase subunit A